jgi:hypothetical protein
MGDRSHGWGIDVWPESGPWKGNTMATQPQPPTVRATTTAAAAPTVPTAQQLAVAVKGHLDRAIRDGIAAELEARQAEMDRAAAAGAGPSAFLSGEWERELPADEVARRRREAETWAMQVQVHGSPEAAHAAEVRQTVRRRAAEARLACTWCGRLATHYEPQPAAWKYPAPHRRQGLPIEPATYDGSDRFTVLPGTVGLCADHVAHTEDGDLAVAIARAVLAATDHDDADDALDVALASRIASRCPRYRGLAAERPWAQLDRDTARAIVEEARADLAAHLLKLGACPRCGETAELSPVHGPLAHQYPKLCPVCRRTLSG